MSTPEQSAEKAQCRYLHAAYPTLGADDTCTEHRHDQPTFALARAMAAAWQQPEPTDEQIGWFMDDAAEVVDDFKPTPQEWVVSETKLSQEVGVEFTMTVNSAEYVIQDNDSGGHVATHPVSRAEWNRWIEEAENA